jgi:hypothetical protein
MAKKKKPAPSSTATRARRISRNVLGATPSSKVIVPKAERKPKYKKPIDAEEG